MKKQDVEHLLRIELQLHSLYEEIKSISNKHPDDAINKFKLKFVNETLSAANEFLGNKDRPFEGFTLFDIDEIPTNSDVVFILSAYLSAFEKIRAFNIDKDVNTSNYVWIIDGKLSDHITFAPRNINK